MMRNLAAGYTLGLLPGALMLAYTILLTPKPIEAPRQVCELPAPIPGALDSLPSQSGAIKDCEFAADADLPECEQDPRHSI